MPSKWLRDLQQKHHGEHMERIRQMRPVVDNKKPRELPLSGKKEIERRRFREKVEKGNRLLLDRLGKALERKNIDNERKPIKFNSLEQGKKKLELKRVTMENQLLLNRIQFAQPMYDHHQWERDAEHREFYLKNMTEFPELYCPHHPPLRKKFLQEKVHKQALVEAAKLKKINEKRAEQGKSPVQTLPRRPRTTEREGMDLSPSRGIPALLPPPTGSPGNGRGRPLGQDAGHGFTSAAGSPDGHGSRNGGHLSGHMSETYYQGKGETLLHGSHNMSVYSGGHHTQAHTQEINTLDPTAHIQYHVTRERAPLNYIPAEYQHADTHGHGHSGLVGGVGEQTMGMVNADMLGYKDMLLMEMSDKNETGNTF